MAGDRKSLSPDVRVVPHGTAGGSSCPGPADPSNSGTIPEGQVAEDESQHLLGKLFSWLHHGVARGRGPHCFQQLRTGERDRVIHGPRKTKVLSEQRSLGVEMFVD